MRAVADQDHEVLERWAGVLHGRHIVPEVVEEGRPCDQRGKRPLVCVISRYHGGAFVVFSKALNPEMTVLAVEGSFASVIGGAPAAAVVFTGEVDKRTAATPAMKALDERIASARNGERIRLRVEQSALRAATRAEKISEVAAEFDGIHDIHRAVEVGSVDAVIPAAMLRPEIIAAIEGHRAN